MTDASQLDDARYRAIAERRRTTDDAFVYAVVTTGIYCRPSCPARLALRKNVRFYDSPDDAERAGHRPCKRCKPREASMFRARDKWLQSARDRLEREEPVPSLAALARDAGVSPWHFQRTFARAVGMSPKAYAKAHRMRLAEEGLREGMSVTRASVEAGYSSSSRFYADAGSFGMSPRALREGGAGVTLAHATRATRFGRMLVAASERGVAAVFFGESARSLAAELRERFPNAKILREDARVGTIADRIARHVDAIGEDTELDVPLDLLGTSFQQRVWRALASVPRGETITYRELARRLGTPRAARAVGSACGQNPCAVLVPCHRVIREDGRLGGYRWGLERKRELLKAERDRQAR